MNRPDQTSRGLRVFAPVCVLLAGALLPGCVLLPAPAPHDYTTLAPPERPAHNLAVYDAAWRHVARGYYDRDYNDADWPAARTRHRPAAEAASSEDELYAAINGMLLELKDDHTGALKPSLIKAERTEQRVLLGLILSPEETAVSEPEVLVLAVMPGGAAAEAGVLPGWILVSCDGRPPREVLGPGKLTAGQTVLCVFRDHANAVREVALTARVTATGPVRFTSDLDGGWRYLRFDKFDGSSRRWLDRQLKANRAARGIVLDLRENPGGDAIALGRMLRGFFRQNVAMGTFISRRGFRFPLEVSAWFAGASFDGPVAVLVSENSASSSEIFSAVMQHHRRATIIGTQTAGAVLASRRYALPDGGRLQLSIDDYVTPDGRRLEGTGVTPDIVVETTPSDRRAGRDPVLDAALRHLAATSTVERS